MVSNNLNFTLASDGLAKGTKPSKPSKRREKKKASSATPATSARDTPASDFTQDHGGKERADAMREPSGSPLFDFSNEEEVARTPVVGGAPEHSVLPDPANNEVINFIKTAVGPEDANQVRDTANAVTFDPTNSERKYYRDAFTGKQREVWRPGDGDGDDKTDYYDRPGQLPQGEKRWRLYQSKTGEGPTKYKTNMPPKYVILDDRAAYEVSSSDIPRATTVKYWSHDFGGAGKIRARRPHRGRGAIANPDAECDDKYHFAKVGQKSEKYYFTGEKDYKPIIYCNISPQPEVEAAKTPAEQSKKRKATSPLTDGPRDPRKHGHNQYTPKENLVKYGAPSAAKGRDRYRPRINTWLRRSPSPPWSKDRSKLYGGVGDQARAFTASMVLQDATGASMALQGVTGAAPTTIRQDRQQSLWIEEEDDDPPAAATEEIAASASDATFDQTRPIEFPDPSPSDAQTPFARAPKESYASEIEPVPEKDIAEEPRRKKLAQPMSFMERMAADPADDSAPVDTSPNAHDKPDLDSGSYASQLEQQLLKAKEYVEHLTSALNHAQEKIEGLETEVVCLRSNLAGTDANTVA